MRAQIQPHIGGPMMLKTALFIASLLASSYAQAATTEWLPSQKMSIYMMRLTMQGLRPTKLICKNVGRTFMLQAFTVPNPERFKWASAWNTTVQWKIIKASWEKRNYRMISHMAYTDPMVGGRFCAVWVGPTW